MRTREWIENQIEFHQNRADEEKNGVTLSIRAWLRAYQEFHAKHYGSLLTDETWVEDAVNSYIARYHIPPEQYEYYVKVILNNYFEAKEMINENWGAEV